MDEKAKEFLCKADRESLLHSLTGTMIAYLEDSEEKHYLECCDDNGTESCKDHIYLIAMEAKTILDNIEEERAEEE